MTSSQHTFAAMNTHMSHLPLGALRSATYAPEGALTPPRGSLTSFRALRESSSSGSQYPDDDTWSRYSGDSSLSSSWDSQSGSESGVEDAVEDGRVAARGLGGGPVLWAEDAYLGPVGLGGGPVHECPGPVGLGGGPVHWEQHQYLRPVGLGGGPVHWPSAMTPPEVCWMHGGSCMTTLNGGGCDMSHEGPLGIGGGPAMRPEREVHGPVGLSFGLQSKSEEISDGLSCVPGGQPREPRLGSRPRSARLAKERRNPYFTPGY